MPIFAIGSCVPWPKWRISGGVPSGKRPIRRNTRSRNLRGMRSQSATICAALSRPRRKSRSTRSPALRTLLEGVEVTERDLFKVFERHGITRFDPLGEKFDPHFHEAMVKVDVPGVPADMVVQVLQAGYKIADRVLRPAAVIVAKGGTPAGRPSALRRRARKSHQAKMRLARRRMEAAAPRAQDAPCTLMLCMSAIPMSSAAQEGRPEAPLDKAAPGSGLGPKNAVRV